MVEFPPDDCVVVAVVVVAAVEVMLIVSFGFRKWYVNAYRARASGGGTGAGDDVPIRVTLSRKLCNVTKLSVTLGAFQTLLFDEFLELKDDPGFSEEIRKIMCKNLQIIIISKKMEFEYFNFFPDWQIRTDFTPTLRSTY